jgi:hypothetical protein
MVLIRSPGINADFKKQAWSQPGLLPSQTSTEPSMQLLTPEHRETMLANGRRYQTDPDFDAIPVVKLFTPWGACTWLLTDLDPEDQDIASGLCDLGFGEPELGSVRISEIESLSGPFGLRAERDVNFVAKGTIGTYAARARIDGQIIA